MSNQLEERIERLEEAVLRLTEMIRQVTEHNNIVIELLKRQIRN